MFLFWGPKEVFFLLLDYEMRQLLCSFVIFPPLKTLFLFFSSERQAPHPPHQHLLQEVFTCHLFPTDLRKQDRKAINN